VKKACQCFYTSNFLPSCFPSFLLFETHSPLAMSEAVGDPGGSIMNSLRYLVWALALLIIPMAEAQPPSRRGEKTSSTRRAIKMNASRLQRPRAERTGGARDEHHRATQSACRRGDAEKTRVEPPAYNLTHFRQDGPASTTTSRPRFAQPLSTTIRLLPSALHRTKFPSIITVDASAAGSTRF